jgi:DNA-binding IclR family transcriptional regulator
MKATAKGQPTTGKGEAVRLSSVTSAIRILKEFGGDDTEIGISELAKRLGVAKSTVYRLATTLVAEGFLEKNPENEKYRLGVGLFSLGAQVRRRMDVSTEAKPQLMELRSSTNETSHLAILNGALIVYINSLESFHAIRMRSETGVSKPAFCSAEGRAMLAFMPRDVVERVLAEPMAPRTARTIVDPAEVGRRIERAALEGYAIEEEETEVGMLSIAAPVRNATGAVVASLGISGPNQRLTADLAKSLAPQVMRAADMVSARLGYHTGMLKWAT